MKKMYELENSELNVLFGKGNYERKKGKIFIRAQIFIRKDIISG
jgi:hypothetical protein